MAEAENLLSGETELAETGKAQQLVTVSHVTTGLLVRATKGNAAVVRIGSSTVGGTSYAMEAGESVQFDVIDPSRIYVYGTEKDKVSYLGLTP
jgi:hypothetical protein